MINFVIEHWGLLALLMVAVTVYRHTIHNKTGKSMGDPIPVSKHKDTNSALKHTVKNTINDNKDKNIIIDRIIGTDGILTWCVEVVGKTVSYLFTTFKVIIFLFIANTSFAQMGNVTTANTSPNFCIQSPKHILSDRNGTLLRNEQVTITVTDKLFIVHSNDYSYEYQHSNWEYNNYGVEETWTCRSETALLKIKYIDGELEYILESPALGADIYFLP